MPQLQLIAFLTSVFADFLTEHGINHIGTSGSHPQVNGGVEHFNRELKDSIQKAQATQRAWKTVVTELLHSYWATLMLQLVGTLSIFSEGCQCRLNWTSCLCRWMDSINTSELKWHRHRTKVHSTQYVSTSIYTEYANLSIGKRRDTVQQSIVGTAAMYPQ